MEEEYKDDPVSALTTAFGLVNEKMNDDDSVDTYMSGTTWYELCVLIQQYSSIAIITDDKLVVANVGDSRVIIGQKTEEIYKCLQISV